MREEYHWTDAGSGYRTPTDWIAFRDHRKSGLHITINSSGHNKGEIRLSRRSAEELLKCLKMRMKDERLALKPKTIGITSKPM